MDDEMRYGAVHDEAQTPSAEPVATPASPAPAAPAAPDEFEMSIEEYCAGRSHNDKRIELVTAFFTTESAKKPRDMKSGFDARFEAFVSRPTV